MPIITGQAPVPVVPKAAPVDTNRQSTTSVEPEAVAPEVPAANESELSPKFAALARKERALQAQAKALKAKEDAMKAQEADYTSKYVQKERLTKEPLAVLEELGLTYDQLTNMILNQPTPQDAAYQKLEAKTKELEERIAKQASSAEEQQTKAYEAAVNQIRNEAKLLIDSDEEFDTIKGTDNVELVVERIKEIHKEEGRILSVQEAAKQIEAELIEQILGVAQLKKIKEKLSPQEINEALKQDSKTPAQPQLKTLTNAVSASSTTKPISERERVQRAIAAFRGELK